MPKNYPNGWGHAVSIVPKMWIAPETGKALAATAAPADLRKGWRKHLQFDERD